MGYLIGGLHIRVIVFGSLRWAPIFHHGNYDMDVAFQ